jgi:hypothetical protein
MRIEEVVASRLWNKGIDSVSAMIYLQQNDFRRLTVQEMQRKSLDTSDVIEDVRTKRETLPLIILNFFFSIIFTSNQIIAHLF